MLGYEQGQDHAMDGYDKKKQVRCEMMCRKIGLIHFGEMYATAYTEENIPRPESGEAYSLLPLENAASG